MTAELSAYSTLAGGVRKVTKDQRLSVPKGIKKKIDAANKERKAQKKSKTDSGVAETEGKKPTASDVRTALKEKKITPVEAADLNPLGGLKPKSKDIEAAEAGGHITSEEALYLKAPRQWKENGF